MEANHIAIDKAMYAADQSKYTLRNRMDARAKANTNLENLPLFLTLAYIGSIDLSCMPIWRMGTHADRDKTMSKKREAFQIRACQAFELSTKICG